MLSVHFGRSANCSSVGSVIDFLYIGTVAASAVLAALAVLVPSDAEEGAQDDAPSDEPDERGQDDEGAR